MNKTEIIEVLNDITWNSNGRYSVEVMNECRREAKDRVSLEEFEESMKGIYTTCVSTSTIDESPMAYKPMDEIISNVKDTVDIIECIKPIYNYKAN